MVAPVTPKVPAIDVLPLDAVTLNLVVLILKSPVTARVPPKVDAPVPTVKVLEPETEVLPLREIAPVPVEKVEAPVWEKLPARDKRPEPAKGLRVISPVFVPPIVRGLFCVVWIVPAPFLNERVPEIEAAPATSRVVVGALVLIPTLVLVVSRFKRLEAKLRAVVLEPRVTVELLAKVRPVPLTVRLPPRVVAPVPRKEKVGLVVVLPKEIFSPPLVVVTAR